VHRGLKISEAQRERFVEHALQSGIASPSSTMIDRRPNLPARRRPLVRLLRRMGAGANVWDHDKHPWIAAEEETIREAVLAGVP
jgi:hypothetical protein